MSVCVGAAGISGKYSRLRLAIRFALTFGFFQASMPVIGFWLGSRLNEYLGMYDHWIAFILLLLVGIKIIHEDIKKSGHCNTKIDHYSYKLLFLLAIATSIDALAVGFTFAFINVNLLFAVTIIGLVTFLLTICGIELGNRLTKIINARLNIYAGIILIVLGIKILIEHLFNL
ncbi:MAG: manganese efflux pump [Oligoflexia bacterium]|nr:manganese efflux pump [Oligoflexia bacterium]